MYVDIVYKGWTFVSIWLFSFETWKFSTFDKLCGYLELSKIPLCPIESKIVQTRESIREIGNSCYVSTFWIFIETSGIDDRDNRKIMRHRYRRLNFNVSIGAVNIHNVNEAFLVRSNSIVENHITTIYTYTSCKIHEFAVTKLVCIYRQNILEIVYPYFRINN